MSRPLPCPAQQMRPSAACCSCLWTTCHECQNPSLLQFQSCLRQQRLSRQPCWLSPLKANCWIFINYIVPKTDLPVFLRGPLQQKLIDGVHAVSGHSKPEFALAFVSKCAAFVEKVGSNVLFGIGLLLLSSGSKSC